MWGDNSPLAGVCPTPPRSPAALPNDPLPFQACSSEEGVLAMGLTLGEKLSAWTCLAPGPRLPLRRRSNYQLGEARGGTQGWDLCAQAFTRTPARGGTGVAGSVQAWRALRVALERVLSEPTAPFGEGEPGGRGWLTGAGDPPILLPPTASAWARRLTPLPGEANGPFQAGGHVALIKREGRRRGGSRCCWWRAGAGRNQSAAAREARGWRAGAGARARAAAASVGGEQPGATRAAAAAMAVAVGRPSVSAGASLSSSASPPALVGVGGSRWPEGIGRDPGGGGGGAGRLRPWLWECA